MREQGVSTADDFGLEGCRSSDMDIVRVPPNGETCGCPLPAGPKTLGLDVRLYWVSLTQLQNGTENTHFQYVTFICFLSALMVVFMNSPQPNDRIRSA